MQVEAKLNRKYMLIACHQVCNLPFLIIFIKHHNLPTWIKGYC